METLPLQHINDMLLASFQHGKIQGTDQRIGPTNWLNELTLSPDAVLSLSNIESELNTSPKARLDQRLA
jgi:hypothetical protein